MGCMIRLKSGLLIDLCALRIPERGLAEGRGDDRGDATMGEDDGIVSRDRQSVWQSGRSSALALALPLPTGTASSATIEGSSTL